MNRVTVNAVYFYDPAPMDALEPRTAALFKRGDKVRVINLHGCPKANTMGQCYIVPATATKNARGVYSADFAMVCVGSLEKTMPSPEPAPATV